MGPVLPLAPASKTGTRPVAMRTGAWGLPLALIGMGRKTWGGRRGGGVKQGPYNRRAGSYGQAEAEARPPRQPTPPSMLRLQRGPGMLAGAHRRI
jgi:hypothetical protein